MPRSRALIPTFLMLAMSLACPVSAESDTTIDASACLKCHGDKISASAFAASVHGKNACTSCHVVITDVDGHAMGAIQPAKVKCVRCHKKEASEHYASVHMLNDINCVDCHGDIHAI